MTFNIQAGAYTGSYREYVTRSWQAVLPHKGKIQNLAAIAKLAEGCDVVGLQEADSVSVRSGFRHQVEYLAESAHFPYWSHQRNRGLGVAQPGNGVLSRFPPSSVRAHRLPGAIPGRGALEVRFGEEPDDLRVVIVHMALTAAGQLKQANYLAELVRPYSNAVVLGDFNCAPDSPALAALFADRHLRPASTLPTFPSWNPVRCIDLVLTTRTVKVKHVEVLAVAVSDHLPVVVEVEVSRHCAETLAALTEQT
ncbi:MAG: endonuclease/exonuclease/phosphatase family protein [Ahniella sp.]|nr:endonuclease/exonuclease/phosphatase family protein [Ahniella sp.]